MTILLSVMSRVTGFATRRVRHVVSIGREYIK